MFTVHLDYIYLPSQSLSFLGPSFILSKPLISFLKVNTRTGPCTAWILMGVGTLQHGEVTKAHSHFFDPLQLMKLGT